MTEFELGWIVGLFEGEGCVYRRNRANAPHPVVEIAMTDEDVVRRAHEVAGVGHVYSGGVMVDYDWCLEYVDGRRYTNLDGAPWESPRYPRIVLVAQPCAAGKHDVVLMNGTYFLYRADLGFWTQHERLEDVVDEHIDHGPDIPATRKGKWVLKKDFTEVRKRINLELGVCQPSVGPTT
jgi:hypothetical protein